MPLNFWGDMKLAASLRSANYLFHKIVPNLFDKTKINNLYSHN